MTRKSAKKKRKAAAKKDTNSVTELDEQSRKFAGSLSPINVREQKERFLQYGLSPEFSFKGRSAADVEKATQTARNAIRMDYFHHAKAILDKVKAEYKDGTHFVNAMYGDEKISIEKATEIIEEYIKEHDLVGEIAIYWSPNLTGSAKMCWKGPHSKHNKPECRNFSLVIKSTKDNKYLTDTGIRCLMNHEIGTHYFRAYNDGFQPWYADRKKFGLNPYGSRNSVSSEEGLACINTAIGGKSKYLWGSALSYYTSCMAAELSFEELFDHLGEYVQDRDYRWKLCMRVKRALSNTDCCGGIGHDQVYFEGAANILSNLDNVDLMAMFSGRVCYDQTSRTKRLARTDSLRLPNFIKDIDKYIYMLRLMAYVNGLGDKPPLPSPDRKLLMNDGKFDYDSYRFKRDGGKSKKKCEPEDTPYMCFTTRDSPVARRPVTAYLRKTVRIDGVSSQASLRNRKDFIYPNSPVPDAHYVRLRDMLYPDLQLDLDTTRSMSKLPSYSNAINNTDTKSLPALMSVPDRLLQKR